MHRKIRLKSQFRRCPVHVRVWSTVWERNMDYSSVFIHVEGPDWKKAKQNTHRRTASLHCPPKSFEKCSVWSFLKEIWLLSGHLCGIFCFQTKFSNVHMETGAISSFRVLARLFLAQVTVQGLVSVLPWEDINILAPSQERSRKD